MTLGNGLSSLLRDPEIGRWPDDGRDYNALARRLQAIPRDEFGDPLETKHVAAMAQADEALTGAAVAMAEADAILKDAAADLDPGDDLFNEQPGDDVATASPTLDDLIEEERRLDYLPDWDDDGVGVLDRGFVDHREGAVFLRDPGEFGLDMDRSRPVMPRPRPSRRVLLGSPAFDQRIKQLAKSWGCSIAMAEDRFFGWDFTGRQLKKPRHAFPVRRTRQFEE